MTYVGPEPERVRRAIVTLAHGRSEELRVLVAAAQTDFRDVLWWEEQEREGRPATPIDVERLAARLQVPPSPPPPQSSAGSLVSVVLLDAAPLTPELMKAIRRASGRGLADVAALVARAPVTIVDGVDRGAAVALQAELAALGARVELR